jgi:hypothetical protein
LNQLALVVGPADAIPALTRALTIDRQAFGPQQPQTLRDARQLAGLLRQTWRVAEAAELERQFKIAPGR